MKKQQELIPLATGEYLKQRRLQRKLSLAKVARDICLDEQCLSDIEADAASHIAPIYQQGYIKKYARYLQVSEDDLQSLLASTIIEESTVQNIFSVPPIRNPMDQWLRATSYVLGSLLIGTLVWQFTHEAVRLSQSGTRFQGEQNVLLPADREAPGQSAQVRKFRGTVNASIAPLRAAPHDPDADSMDTAALAWSAVSSSVLADGESHLQISVSADSWVEISDANGQELEMDLLRGGSEKSYHGKPPFRILFGRAAAVRLSMDGEQVDLTSFMRGDVAQLTWPPELQANNQEPAKH